MNNSRSTSAKAFLAGAMLIFVGWVMVTYPGNPMAWGTGWAGVAIGTFLVGRSVWILMKDVPHA